MEAARPGRHGLGRLGRSPGATGAWWPPTWTTWPPAGTVGRRRPGCLCSDPGTPSRRWRFLFPGQGSQSPGHAPRPVRRLPAAAALAGAGDAGAGRPPCSRPPRSAPTRPTASGPPSPTPGWPSRRWAWPDWRYTTCSEVSASWPTWPAATATANWWRWPPAGALDPPDLIDLSVARGDAIVAAAAGAGAGGSAGTMAAVSAPIDQVRPSLSPDVVVANHNSPNQVVISGPATGGRSHRGPAAGTRAFGQTAPGGVRLPQPVGGGRRRHPGRRAGDPAGPAGVNPGLVQHHRRALSGRPRRHPRNTLARQVAEPVRFVEQIEAMYAAGARVFVEAGPGRVLTGLIGKILGARPHVAVACDVAGESGMQRLLLALAELAVAGRGGRHRTALYRGRHTRKATAAGMPRRPGWLVNGHLVRTVNGEYLPGGLRPANTLARQPACRLRRGNTRRSGHHRLRPWRPGRCVVVPAPLDPAPAAASSERDAVVLEFLRGTRELIVAQRDVLLGYLGTGGESLPGLGSAFAPGAAGMARPRSSSRLPPTTVLRPPTVAADWLAPQASRGRPAPRASAGLGGNRGSGGGAAPVAPSPGGRCWKRCWPSSAIAPVTRSTCSIPTSTWRPI